MEIDLDLLAYLVGKGSRYIEGAVQGTTYLPRTVAGVGTYLLDNDGNVDLLTSKQQVTYDKFLKPLLFAVPCRGVAGDGVCPGTGLIEADFLLKSYRDDVLCCRSCRAAKAATATA
ncbi:MAG: hypothetical protein A2091_03220 [Desulfuromonadales bacterium GWD2_61_12]|nr:MAG: hypothetical protein A2005_11880 [Desulfuromonadales bacterium GWC2_61_20]OGR35034.1 MAG: hypothetical protein A2091_03220 [Desulfuromonadales bacterium GWD2_61_12]